MISRPISVNRSAHHEYTILEQIEAGIVLTGEEVKSARIHGISIKESYVGEMQNSGELYLFNANFPEYKQAAHVEQVPKRPRKLLPHKKQVNKWLGQVRRKGFTIVPLQIYFNERGIVKVEIALARGKNVVDKRETIKQREWERQKHRILKN